MPTPKRKKPLVCTRYAVKDRFGKWIGNYGESTGSRDHARLHAEREEWMSTDGRTCYPVRCRWLSSKTARSRKRTR